MNRKLSLLVLSVFFINVLTPIVLAINTKFLYISFFNENNVVENFSDTDELNRNFNNLFKYITFRNSELPNNIFSTEDIIHMRDVKSLFIITYIVLAGFLLLYFFLRSDKTDRLSALRIGSVGSIVFILVVIVFTVLFSFVSVFVLFHRLFFNNNYWLLDPSNSYLIKFFPTEVFENFATLIGIGIILMSFINIVSTWNKKKREK